MKKNIIIKKGIILPVVSIILILLLIVFLSFEKNVQSLGIVKTSFIKKMEEKNNSSSSGSKSQEMYKYLSDIEYIKEPTETISEKSSVEWGSITLDSNLETQYNNGLITLIVDGEKKSFLKGISAHATSTLIYDISDYDFDHFSTYIGVDESRGTNGDGVKFKIFTSTNGTDWKLEKESNVLRANANAELVTIDLNDEIKYLKLYCDRNGSNASDHSVYANAKLYKDGYEEKKPEDIDFIKTVEQYDAELKDIELDKQINEKEFVLLKRNFVNNVGYDLLVNIVNLDPDYEEAVKWLMSDVNNLRLYVLGGAPDGGSYYNSIKELSRLYKEYKEDFKNETKTNNPWDKNLTKGEVYKKMAISLSLTHATKVGYWAQIDHPSNRSDSVNRYKIYKKLYDEGKFIVVRNVSEDGTITPVLKDDGTPVQDHTPWFEALTVEEMRYVMNNITDDEELEWLNAYTQKRIDENQNQPEKYLQPHTYIAYVWPDFERKEFHDPSLQYTYWDQLFEGIFSEYHVTYSTENDHVYKAWMSMRNKYETGAVCGGISKLGCHIRAAHGTPASVISQPGHAAIIYYRKDANGKGYWSMDNDVSGWAQSGKSEKMQTRMPLGWGSDSYVEGWAATYMMLSQEAINDYANYEKSEKIIMTADLYNNDLKKKEEIYREALKVQKINIDAWWGLINVYNADTNRTDEDYYNLAKELGEALMPFPLPMKNLLDQIEPKIKDIKYSFSFTLLETELLNEGKNLSDDTAKNPETYKVYQPGITRVVANYLLGQTDTSLASFSFDGADAEKIVLSSRFDGVGVRWDYNLSGASTINDKQKWKEISFDADEAHKLQLTKSEVESITAENDIYIHIVGTDYSESNIYKIDIEEQELLNNLYANDLENRVMGVDLSTQWRYKEGDNWTSYSVASPDLTGDKTVQVRQAPTGNKLASKASEVYKFTQDNQPDERKYISVTNLSIKGYPDNEENAGYSSQSVDGKRPFYAPNAIDGNINTMWHTDFRYNVIDQGIKPYIVIELDEPRYISAVEFIQTKYKPDDPDYVKNMTVYVSMDGENWTNAIKSEDYPQNTELRKIDLKSSMQAKYVKLELETYNMFGSIAMVNLFEDITKVDRTKPTAGIYYSTKEETSDYVIVRLINPSTEITITNNDGKDTYVFKENGKFTFEFKDKDGNKGTATAEVTWIDKDTPTANVEYKLDGDKKLSILLDSISEDVYLLDKNNNKINYIEVNDKKVSKISYLDEAGNVYKQSELDSDGNIVKNTYANTTGKSENVETYVTILTNGEVTGEDFLDENGNSVDIQDNEKEAFRRLQQVKTNPLEYTFEESGDYEFKFLDKASNIAYKSIKANYLEDNNIIASDISYDITKLTNKNVVATINPYMINSEGDKLDVKIVNNGATNKYTFEKNSEFTFQYKDALDTGNVEIQEHKAKVDWIDKDKPTAEIIYSINEETSEPVTAKLINESEEIVVTNNGTNREFTFDKNGEFTFEFEDAAGNVGKAVAKVNWIEEKQDDDDKNTGSDSEILEGDVNKDGKITSTDLLLVKRHLVAGDKKEWILTGDDFKEADINKDGQMTATDLLLMKRLLLKQIEAE